MKEKLIVITKMILTIFTFGVVSIILRIGPQIVVGLLNTCCIEFDVNSEFKQHIFLFASYGICDFISIFISLLIFNRKREISNKLFMFIFIIILIINNIYVFMGTYDSNNLVLLEDLNVYLIMINILFLIINSVLIRKKLLKR